MRDLVSLPPTKPHLLPSRAALTCSSGGPSLRGLSGVRRDKPGTGSGGGELGRLTRVLGEGWLGPGAGVLLFCVGVWDRAVGWGRDPAALLGSLRVSAGALSMRETDRVRLWRGGCQGQRGRPAA